MKKLIILTMFFLVNNTLYAQNNTRELVLTRTISQLPIKFNKQIISIANTYEVSFIYPKTHRIYSNTIITNKTLTSYNHLFNQIDLNWNTSNLQKATSLNKAKQNGKYFYSSDPDIFELSLFENNTKIWSIVIDNLEEMKFYNKESKNLSLLFSTIEEMESLSIQYITTKVKEERK